MTDSDVWKRLGELRKRTTGYSPQPGDIISAEWIDDAVDYIDQLEKQIEMLEKKLDNHDRR